MDYLQKFVAQVRSRLFIGLLLNNALLVLDWWILHDVLEVGTMQLIIGLAVVAALSLTILPWLSAKFITEPTRLIWQGILHIAPDVANVPAPNLKKRSMGHDLVTYLVSHVYQLASVVDTIEKTAGNKPTDLASEFVANSLPLPLVIFDKNHTIMFANTAMCSYLKRSSADTIGQNVYSIMDMSFGNAETLDKWLSDVKVNMPAATKTWERVRLNPQGGEGATLQFDLAAYYNKSNSEGFETMLVLFDHTASYSQDDQALSFVAIAVHELRTPITLLRGYLEALEEDLEDKLDPEQAGFIHKMKATAQSLTAFINNMLNVARIENDQLELKLREEQWPGIIEAAVNDLALRARIMGVEITAEVAPNLPTVGADRVSVYEVLINLADNAIKYSSKSSVKKVTIKSYLNQEGLIETTVQDQGVGIAANILPNLFEKFYRSHRSRAQIGGTGLGLYLSKAIVEAHGGHIWVRSKEGEGSTFGFTVKPYSQLADEQKNGDNNDISRGAHGWIKNHSLYSR